MLKNIMSTLGFNDSTLSADELAELERVTLEDRLVELSLKAHKNDCGFRDSLPSITVVEITDPEVIREMMDEINSLAIEANKNPDGTTVSDVEYKRAEIDRGRDPWGSVSERSIR